MGSAEREVEFPCPKRRLRTVENVAAHHHRIRALTVDDGYQLMKKVALLLLTVVVVQRMAEMPVAGMKDFHKC